MIFQNLRAGPAGAGDTAHLLTAGGDPLPCARRLLRPTLSPCVFLPFPNKFCKFSRVICARTVKNDLCSKICRKNSTNGTSAFAPIAPLPFPIPARNVMLVLVHAVLGPTSPRFCFLLSFLFSFTYFALFSFSHSFLSAKPMHKVETDPQVKLVSDICCSRAVFFRKLSSVCWM